MFLPASARQHKMFDRQTARKWSMDLCQPAYLGTVKNCFFLTNPHNFFKYLCLANITVSTSDGSQQKLIRPKINIDRKIRSNDKRSSYLVGQPK